MAADLKRAALLFERGNTSEAFAIFNEALNEDPEKWGALYDAGLCLMLGGNYGLGANIMQRAFEGEREPGILQNIGYAYRRMNRDDIAEQIWRLALTMPMKDRQKAQILGNIAGRYVQNGTPEKAIEIYAEAMALDPDNIGLSCNLGMAQLEAGLWKDGFLNYHMGFKAGARTARHYPKAGKSWEPGDDVKGKSVIVYGEQGIGDEIMFASCIPDLMRDASKVVFDCHPRLEGLFKRSFGIECHGTRKTGLAEWPHETPSDLSMSISDLPIIYRSNGEFPGTPYLTAPVEKTLGKLRIGISWRGGSDTNKPHKRSIPLPQWEGVIRALERKGADFYSLQYTPEAAQDVADFHEKTGIHVKHYPGKVQHEDYDVTAHFVAGLDLVISVCTSVIHLAGALGVLCWCLTPMNAAWRYGVRGPMPWYRSVKLYRQDGEDWGPVFGKVEADLAHI